MPLKDDRRLYEMLVLEGFQAGLSWITILRKRDNFRQAFDDFAPEKIAAYGPEKIAALLADPGIVRNRAKIEGAILSARGWLELMQQQGGFSGFLWQFVDGTGRSSITRARWATSRPRAPRRGRCRRR